MGSVDPADDTIDRYIVYRYGLTSSVKGRHNSTVAAFDNADEYNGLLRELDPDLKQRQSADPKADPYERISGVHKAPGSDATDRAEREFRRAAKHGAADPGVEERLPPRSVVSARRHSP
jgi:hypothetical protein